MNNEYYLLESESFQWMQLVDALETSWKQSIREKNTNLNSLSFYDHHLIKNNQVYFRSKPNSKELYNILILGNYTQGYFEAFFESSTIDYHYLLSRKTTINTKLCSFQYKALKNSLYLNKLLFKFGIIESSLSSFCKSAKETNIHLFSECLCEQYIWSQTQIFFSGYITIPDDPPQSAIFGFTDTSIEPFYKKSKLSISLGQ